MGNFQKKEKIILLDSDSDSDSDKQGNIPASASPVATVTTVTAASTAVIDDIDDGQVIEEFCLPRRRDWQHDETPFHDARDDNIVLLDDDDDDEPEKEKGEEEENNQVEHLTSSGDGRETSFTHFPSEDESYNLDDDDDVDDDDEVENKVKFKNIDPIEEDELEKEKEEEEEEEEGCSYANTIYRKRNAWPYRKGYSNSSDEILSEDEESKKSDNDNLDSDSGKLQKLTDLQNNPSKQLKKAPHASNDENQLKKKKTGTNIVDGKQENNAQEAFSKLNNTNKETLPENKCIADIVLNKPQNNEIIEEKNQLESNDAEIVTEETVVEVEQDILMEEVSQEQQDKVDSKQSILESYVDNAVKERIEELKKQQEKEQSITTIEQVTIEKISNEITPIVEPTKEVDIVVEPMDQDEKPEEIPISKVAVRNDPYSGYLAPNGRKSKRQKTKKQRIMEPTNVYNNVIVSYDQDTMPLDMQK